MDPNGALKIVEPKQIRALLISDSHVHGQYLNHLALWLKETKTEYDVVFILGNMANMTNELRNLPAAENQATQQVADTLRFFVEHVKKPVFYLPGNTEPTSLYSYGFEIPNAINIHKRAVQLDESLILVGLGGAIPISKDKKDILEGFPYKNDEDFSKDVNACLESASKKFGNDVDYILLTHIGPSASTTSDVLLEKEKLNAGSAGLSETLKKHNETLLCHIHGHSSYLEGMSKPFGPSCPVINPGGIIAGHFGELSLFRGPNGRWSVTSVKFHNLPILL
jgi:Icc-related predicted phosphoesterase